MSDAVPPLVGRLAGLTPAEQARLVRTAVRAEARCRARPRRHRAVDADRPFRDLGFDSLTAVDLRDRLAAATGLALPAGLIFDYPTAAVLAEHLVAELARQPRSPRRRRRTSAPTSRSPSSG